MSRKQWILAGLMTIVLITLGGFREIIFVNINEQIVFNSGQVETYRVLDALSFLQDYDTESLTSLKWILTVSFALVFLLLAMVSFRFILQDKAGAKWMLVVYAGGIILAGIVFIVGRLFGDPEIGYTLSRAIMGALQSPFPLMLMIPARMLAER